MLRLDELAAFTEVPGQLTRRYLSPAHLEAMRQVEAWMHEAGMQVSTDALCSMFGRYEGQRPNAPALLLGSHLDTVLDAGRYDGALGVLAAIAVVAELARTGDRLPMSERCDALMAASEMLLAIERLAVGENDLVATVGQITALPGAQNVIPGTVKFSVDMRSPSDAVRERAHDALQQALQQIAARRGVRVEARTHQTNPATPLACLVIDTVCEAIAACGPGAVAPGVGRRSRRWQHGQALPGRDDFPALQGRHQPQSRRVDHQRGCGPRRARAA